MISVKMFVRHLRAQHFIRAVQGRVEKSALFERFLLHFGNYEEKLGKTIKVLRERFLVYCLFIYIRINLLLIHYMSKCKYY